MEEKKKGWEVGVSSVTKITIAIIIAIAVFHGPRSCGVSKKTIQECRSACSTKGMQSVSQWSCQCGWKSEREWVIPRKSEEKK